MKFLEVLRFELLYQARRASTWIYFIVLLVIAFLVTGNYLEEALNRNFFVNAPYIIAAITVLTTLFWLLIAAAVAGEAAARDVQTRMYLLTYTTKISKASYLGGKFIAAFVLNSLLLLAVPAGFMLFIYLPGLEAKVIGPFHGAPYLSSYFFIAVPTVFTVTAIQFSWATLKRRVTASYLAGLLVFMSAYIITFTIGSGELGKTLDLIGMASIVSDWDKLSSVEMNTRQITLEGPLLWSRLLWMVIALSLLLFTYLRFRFSVEGSRSVHHKQGIQKFSTDHEVSTILGITAISVPMLSRSFDFKNHFYQMTAIARASFTTIMIRRGGLILLTVIALLTFLTIPGRIENTGGSLQISTAHVLTFLTSTLGSLKSPWIFITLLLIFWAGELIWREKEARLSDIYDAAPVPEWALLIGKLLGLVFVLIAWMSLLTIAAVFIQISISDINPDVGLYLQVFFGPQLIEYLLFTVLVVVVHVLVNQKYIGNLVAVLTYCYIAFAPILGIENKLLVFGSGPGWSYSDIHDFGSTLSTWFWFKLYWILWAVLLIIAASLLWVRGREHGLKQRLKLTRSRFNSTRVVVSILALGLICVLAGFISSSLST